jgi:hypothetical protein
LLSASYSFANDFTPLSAHGKAIFSRHFPYDIRPVNIAGHSVGRSTHNGENGSGLKGLLPKSVSTPFGVAAFLPARSYRSVAGGRWQAGETPNSLGKYPAAAAKAALAKEATTRASQSPTLHSALATARSAATTGKVVWATGPMFYVEGLTPFALEMSVN